MSSEAAMLALGCRLADVARIGDVIALHAAMDYLDKLGRDRIAQHDIELSAYAYERLAEAAEFESGKDIWRIADARTDVAPVLKELFRERAGDPAKGEFTRRDMFVRNFTGDSAEDALANLKKMAGEGRPVPAGRALLAGTTWDGHLNMRDSMQMRRAGAYVGGWKTLSL